jgi:hypothetical protein
MTTTTFLVKSGNEESGPYKVTITRELGLTKIKCNCQAGKFGQYCKHKMRIIKGHEDVLHDESQAEDLASIADFFQQEEFIKMRSEMTKAEEALGKAEENVKQIRKKIALAMKNGI